MRVSVALSYPGADGEPPATSFLSFTLPLNFVRLRSSVRTNTLSSEHLSLSNSPSLPVTLPATDPYDVPELPAYSQLFYSNGGVKRDDCVPLPLYTPCPPPDHTSKVEH